MGNSDNQTKGRMTRRRVIQGVLSLAVVVAIFAFALPKVADFGEVRAEITEMTWLELLTLLAVSAWNIVTYWAVMVASLPGLNYWQAMKVNQTSTAIANTMPAGGALGVGVTYGMYSSYGFTNAGIARSVVVSGIWNNFVKLGMPVIALALLVVQGAGSTGLATAAVAGLAVLAGALVLFGLTLRSDELAARVGSWSSRVFSKLRRLARKAPVADRGPSFVRFRADTVDLLRHRWIRLTVATLVSHISLYAVLLISLRHVGVSEAEVGWAEVLAAFAFVRLISALPITPGGLGVVELGLTAALVAAGGNEAEVVAAVLVYRAFTYLLPIPFGAVTYLAWRRGAERRRRAAGGDPAVTAAR